MEVKELLKAIQLETLGDIVELGLMISKRLDRLDPDSEHVERCKALNDAFFFGLNEIKKEIDVAVKMNEENTHNKVLEISDKIELRNNLK